MSNLVLFFLLLHLYVASFVNPSVHLHLLRNMLTTVFWTIYNINQTIIIAIK